MYEAPFSSDILNQMQGQLPQSFVRVHGTWASRFFKRYLLQDAISTLKFTVPGTWDLDYFRYCLFGLGYVAVLRTDLYGVIPQQCTLSGMNVYYRPTRVLISNPLLKSVDLVINRQCSLIKLMPDYGSVADLIDYYGDLMALTYESLSVNILNSRLAYLIGVDGKSEADTFKSLFDDVLSGKPAVVYRKKTAVASAMKSSPQWETVLQNVRQSFVAPELLEALTSIRDEFLTVIGIPTISDRKKERVNLVDSQRNTFETQTKIDLWLEEVQDGIDRTRALFPDLEPLSVEKRYKPMTGGAGDVSEAFSSGTV